MVARRAPSTLFSSDIEIAVLPTCDHYAGSERFIQKAFDLQAESAIQFDVTCDLEDGAAQGNEKEQLQMVVDHITSRKHTQGRVGIRLHDLGIKFVEREVRAVMTALSGKVSYITVPKATSAKQLTKLHRLLTKYRRTQKSAEIPPLHVLIETRQAIAEVNEIAALPFVASLDFGLLDFISDHQGVIPEAAMRSPTQFDHALIVRAKTEIAAAALRFGKVATHNVCIDVSDPQQCRADALIARNRFGFTRMWSIHPSQIGPIIQAMMPDFSGLSDAEEILAQAEACDWAPIRFKNKLYDRASYRSCLTLIRQAELYKV